LLLLYLTVLAGHASGEAFISDERGGMHYQAMSMK
jgi:hypothetical protein